MMIFSCGHTSDDPNFMGHNVSIAEYDRLNERCVVYKSVCDRCLVMHQSAGDLLTTEQEIEDWLRGDK